MDIYITNLKTGDRLRLPMLPEEITGTLSNRFASYNVIRDGEVRIPNGTMLDSYTWEAYFPGKPRKKQPFLRGWENPKKCDSFMRHLLAKNGKPVKARLLVTETQINQDVYLQSYVPVETGGYGDIRYTATFIRAKQISVSDSSKSSSASKKGDAPERTSPPKAQTVTVKSGDTLYKIAQAVVGAGAQYMKLYDANKGTIGSTPLTVKAGQVLTIPK